MCGEIKNQSICLPSSPLVKGEVGRLSDGGLTTVSPLASGIGNSSGSKFQSPPMTFVVPVQVEDVERTSAHLQMDDHVHPASLRVVSTAVRHNCRDSDSREDCQSPLRSASGLIQRWYKEAVILTRFSFIHRFGNTTRRQKGFLNKDDFLLHCGTRGRPYVTTLWG
eukprot:991440-Amphidinium_carterae.2